MSERDAALSRLRRAGQRTKKTRARTFQKLTEELISRFASQLDYVPEFDHKPLPVKREAAERAAHEALGYLMNEEILARRHREIP